jgi:hypothetical protein
MPPLPVQIRAPFQHGRDSFSACQRIAPRYRALPVTAAFVVLSSQSDAAKYFTPHADIGLRPAQFIPETIMYTFLLLLAQRPRFRLVVENGKRHGNGQGR